MITKDTLLQRSPELEIKLYSDDRLKIEFQGQRYSVDFLGLKILDAFSKPRTVDEVLSDFSSAVHGAQEWIDLTQTIVGLTRAGILKRFNNHNTLVLKPHPGGFDAASIHIRMLRDRRRTQTYLEAIRNVVNPGDVVVDIGTGTGVLAVAAAQAGASRVYAIEATEIARSAQHIFDASEYSEKINLMRGWSTQVSLPEQADVLISEIIGNDPFGERVLEATIDARKRFVKPTARLIPARIEVYALPVTIPAEIYSEYVFTQADLQNWLAWYGVDFSPLSESKLEEPFFFGVNTYETRSWSRLAGGKHLLSVNFGGIDSLVIQAETQFEAEIDGLLNGVLIYFDLVLSDVVHLSISPDDTDPTNSWDTLVWLVTQPIDLKRGEHLRLRYAYNGAGVPDGVWVDRIG